MIVALIIIFGVFILLSFIIGINYGQKFAIKENMYTPNIEKPKISKPKYNEEEIDEEMKILLQVMENVEAYDGTAKNQKKIKDGV